MNNSKLPIRTRLRDIAGQEGCDGEPYDTMQEASNYIETLERVIQMCFNDSCGRSGKVSKSTAIELIKYANTRV